MIALWEGEEVRLKCDVWSFRNGVAEDSVVLGGDVASVGNLIRRFDAS